MKGNIHDLPAAGPDDATQPGDEGEEMSEEDDDDDNNNWLMARYDYIIQKEERVDTQGHILGEIPDLEFEKHKNVKKLFCDA